jgi:hypothetical protein
MLEVGSSYDLAVANRLEYACEPLPPPFPAPDPNRCPGAAPALVRADTVQATLDLDESWDLEDEPFGSRSFSGTVDAAARICTVAGDGSQTCVDAQGSGRVQVVRRVIYCPEIDVIGFDLEKREVCADHAPGDTVLSVIVMVQEADELVRDQLRFLVRGSEDGQGTAAGTWEMLGVDRMRSLTSWAMARRD